jgi:hypothetical protein
MRGFCPVDHRDGLSICLINLNPEQATWKAEMDRHFATYPDRLDDIDRPISHPITETKISIEWLAITHEKENDNYQLRGQKVNHPPMSNPDTNFHRRDLPGWMRSFELNDVVN